MEEIERALAEHGFTVQVEPAQDNPVMPNQVPGMTHWSVTLDGGVSPLAFPVSIQRDEPPSAAEALAFLAADLRQPGLEGTPEEWLAACGVDPDAPEAEGFLRARMAALDLLDDARALPEGPRRILLGEGPALRPPGM